MLEEEDDQSLSPVLFTPATHKKKSLDKLLQSKDDSWSLASLMKENENFYDWTPFLKRGTSLSQITPQDFIRRRSLSSKKSTIGKSLDALLDPDVSIHWDNEMATPPISKICDNGLKVGDSENNRADLIDVTKKNVARILFEDPTSKEPESSICVLLDDSCKEIDRARLKSPNLFDTSEIPSCGNSYEMSPPITALKSKQIQKNSNKMLEHSLGVSLFDSPPRTNNQRKFSSTSTYDESGYNLFGSPPVTSFIKHPVKSNKYSNSPKENFEEHEEEDDVFLSPSITSIHVHQNKNKVIPKMTQSTPIVSKSTKTTIHLPEPHTVGDFGSLEEKCNDTDADCIQKKSIDLSPSVIDWNANSLLRLSKTDVPDEDDELNLSPSVIHSSKSTNNTSESKYQEAEKNSSASNLEKSLFELSNLPLHFEVEVDKSKAFFYPKVSTVSNKCLDSVSVIDNDLLPGEMTICKRNNVETCGKVTTKQKEQSSFIDMNELSQLPFHLIESQSMKVKEDLKLKNIEKTPKAKHKLATLNKDKIEIEANANILKKNFTSNTFFDNDRSVLFNGFQNVKGKSVPISDRALKAAKPKFEEEEEEESIHHSSAKYNNKIKTIFAGFQTAKGNSVQISESALKSAKQKFESDKLELSEPSNSKGKGIKTETPFLGFQTAKGKNVQISESALKAAKQKFESDEINNKSNSNATPFTGFQTAKGKNVKISESALKAAKQKFESDEINNESNSNATPFTGFQTAKGNNVQISESALKAAKQKFESDEVSHTSNSTATPFTGFQTAKGKNVKISESALKAAKQKFESDEINNKSNSNATPFTGFQTAKGNNVQISESALKAAKQKFESDEVSHTSNSTATPFTGFQTAKGKNVKISESALKAAKQKFESDEINNKSNSNATPFTGFQTAKGNNVQISESALKAAKQKFESDEITNKSNSTTTSFTAFQTAKGNNVQISGSALKVVKQKFESDKVSHTSNGTATPFTGFQTAKGKNVKISESAFKAAKQKFESDEISNKSNSIATSFTGFQTAKGKNVQISESALKVAKQTIESDEIASISEKLLKSGQSKFNADKTNSISKFTTPGYHLNQHNKYISMEAPKAKRKIHYTTPDQYQFDRAVTMTKPLSPAVARYTSKQKGKSGNDQKTNKAKNLSNSFMTPFKSLKRSSTKENQPKVENKRRKKNLFSYKPLFVSRIAENVEEQKQNESNKPRMRIDGMYETKKKTKSSFPEFVNYCCPSVYSRKELQDYGLHHSIIELNGDNVLEFSFDAKRYFISHVALPGKMVLCCGFHIAINDKIEIGLSELKSAFMSCVDIDKSLVPEGWVENHFKWVVWKLAAYERRFPDQFANKCLTPFVVMEQLRYRYDKELEKAERSCLKKIYERDDISTRRLILFVSDILQGASNNNQKCKSLIKLSDGWYEIKAGLDQPLSAFVDQKKITIGTKLCVYGAELVGSTQACPPLQAPEDLMLILSTNSTRRASWDTKLGFQPIKQAFAVPLTSLYSDGGSVGCINATILRKYPTQWMQKEEGKCIFRNLQQEEETKKKYEEQKQNKMETLYAFIQKEFEKSNNKGRKRKRQSMTIKEIGGIKDGRDIYDAIQNAIDPSAIECYLSHSQKEAVYEHKQKIQAQEQEKLMRKFQNQWQQIVEEKFPDRSVVHLQRYRICECPTLNSKRKPFKDAILTVWKPTEDINENFKEGSNLKLFNLNTSASRYKQTSCNFQLSTTNTTKYRLIEEDICSETIEYVPRQVTLIDELYTKSHVPYNEIDVVAYVLAVERQKSMEDVLYLFDGGERFLAVKIWNNAQNVLNKLKDSVIAATNLSWQKFSTPSRNRIIHVHFTDFSNFSKNPKAEHLRKAMSKYQRSLTEKTVQGANSILEQQLQANTSIKKLPPVASIELTNNKLINQTTPLKPEQSFGVNLPSEKLQSRQKLQIKKRLSLDRYHKPPGLSPLQARENGVLKSKFKPPSSLT